MKIAIYANEIARSGKRGVKTYSREIINHLLVIDDRNDYTLYAQADITPEITSDRAKLIVSDNKKRLWAFREFPRLIKKDHPDVVFMPIQTLPFFIWHRTKPKVVVTVHDVAFRLFPGHFTLPRRKLLEFHTRRAIKLSDKIIVPSIATRDDILRFYPVKADKIVVIPHGFADKPMDNASMDDKARTLTGGKPYILAVGTIQPRKNLVRLAEAFAMIKKPQQQADIKLVICGGKGWMHEEIYAQIAKNPFRRDIILTGEVEDDFLSALYKKALIFVMPSLYEGFGLPVLEAMSHGLPVACGNNSSLAEIVGDSGMLFDTMSAEDIAAQMQMLISSQTLRAELSAKSLQRVNDFSWEKAARETLSVLEEL